MAESKATEKQITIFNKKAPGLLAVVEKFEIVNDETREELRQIGKGYEENVKTVNEYFKDDVERADKLHKSLTGKRKVLRDNYSKAIKEIKDKLGLYDKKVIEDKRQIELKEQKEEQEKHARLIESARKKTEKLVEGVKDNEQQILILDSELEREECTEEEATVIRGQIVVLETAIANKQEKVETVVEKVEYEAPVRTSVSSAPKPTGYEVEVTDLRALCAAIGRMDAPEGLISKVNESDLKKFRKMGQKYPGVKYTPTFSKGRL